MAKRSHASQLAGNHLRQTDGEDQHDEGEGVNAEREHEMIDEVEILAPPDMEQGQQQGVERQEQEQRARQPGRQRAVQRRRIGGQPVQRAVDVLFDVNGGLALGLAVDLDDAADRAAARALPSATGSNDRRQCARRSACCVVKLKWPPGRSAFSFLIGIRGLTNFFTLRIGGVVRILVVGRVRR